jgi:hypothetical protein
MTLPDELLEAYDRGCRGQADVDMRRILHEIIQDVRHSTRLAMASAGIPEQTVIQVDAVVDNYVANHYADR